MLMLQYGHVEILLRKKLKHQEHILGYFFYLGNRFLYSLVPFFALFSVSPLQSHHFMLSALNVRSFWNSCLWVQTNLCRQCLQVNIWRISREVFCKFFSGENLFWKVLVEAIILEQYAEHLFIICQHQFNAESVSRHQKPVGKSWAELQIDSSSLVFKLGI